jgi:hypothetical protein
MTCDDRQLQLGLMMDAESGDPEPAGLFAHLEGCAGCRQFLDSLIRFRGAARRDREELLRQADESLPERFPLPAGPESRSAPDPRRSTWWRPALPAAAALGVAALLFVAGVTTGLGLAIALGRAPQRAPGTGAANPARGVTTYVYVCSMPQIDVIGRPLPATAE